MRTTKVVGFLFSCLAGLTVGSCRTVKPANTGRVYVSPVSVIDWNRYGAKFQPAFQLEEKEALTRAVADTLQVERSVLDSFEAMLQLKTMASHFEGSNDPAKLDPTPSTDTAPILSDAFPALEKSGLAVDPRLQYLLATALWQEVQVLNHYVRSVQGYETRDSVYVPYLLRLQVVGLPDSLRSAYIADLDLVFTTAGTDSDAPVLVQPLLINDHIESALASRRDEDIRRLALGLAALFKGIGVGIDLDSYHREVERSLAREFNSLLTVAPTDEGRITVRVGPRRVGDGEYVSTSEPRFVSLLVMVPFKANDLRTDSESVTGQEGSPNDLPRDSTLNVKYGVILREPGNGRPAHTQQEKQVKIRLQSPDQQWLEGYQTALALDDGTKTVVTLHGARGFWPGEVSARWFFEDAERRDTPAIMHAVSGGETLFDAEAQRLTFEFPSLSQMGVVPRAAGVPTAIKTKEQDMGSGDAGDTEWARVATKERTLVVTLRDREREDGKDKYIHLFFPWIYKATKPVGDKPGFELDLPAVLTVDQSGKAVLPLTVKLPKDTAKKPVTGFKLTISHVASITATYPDGIATPPRTPTKEIALVGDGTLLIELANLTAGATITITAKGPPGYSVPGESKLEVKTSGGN